MVDDLRLAIQAIPPGPSKVYNCDWNYGSFLLWQRPDLRFVDLLDPRFLEVAPEKFEAKRHIDLGDEPDVPGVLVRLFHADYVLCSNPNVERALAGTTVLYQGARSPIRLYALSVAPGP